MRFSKFSYAENKTPKNYKCGKCGATGVKLWREYNTFLDYQELTCATCTAEKAEYGQDIKSITRKGMINSEMGFGHHLGGKVPAVPTEEGDTMWGFTSVPEPGCIWWAKLPNFLPKKICCKTMKQQLEWYCEQHDYAGDCPDCTVQYYQDYNEYGITIYGSPAHMVIKFCPWCGKKLPKSKR